MNETMMEKYKFDTAVTKAIDDMQMEVLYACLQDFLTEVYSVLSGFSTVAVVFH